MAIGHSAYYFFCELIVRYIAAVELPHFPETNPIL